jgi:hypothetical protein
MVVSPAGLGPKNECAGEDQQRLYASSRQRGRPISTNPELSDSNNNLVMGPRWEPHTKTDRLTERQGDPTGDKAGSLSWPAFLEAGCELLKSSVCWDITPCSQFKVHRRF